MVFAELRRTCQSRAISTDYLWSLKVDVNRKGKRTMEVMADTLSDIRGNGERGPGCGARWHKCITREYIFNNVDFSN